MTCPGTASDFQITTVVSTPPVAGPTAAATSTTPIPEASAARVYEAVPVATAAPIVATATGSSLAFTGADIWQSVLVGVLLIGGGLMLVRLGRSRHRIS